MKDDRLFFKSGNRILIIHQHEIKWLEAENSYVRIYCETETHLIRSHIYQLEDELDTYNFLRINRSVIVNLDFVKEMRPWLRGTYHITLRDGTELNLSRSYRENLDLVISRPIGFRSIIPQ